MAVDVETILRTVMAGRGVRAAGAIPPGIDGHDESRAPYRYDPAEARRLLAAAGYPNGFSLQRWRSQRAELRQLVAWADVERERATTYRGRVRELEALRERVERRERAARAGGDDRD